MLHKKIFLLPILMMLGTIIFAQKNSGPGSTQDLHPDTIFNNRVTEIIRESNIEKKEQLYRQLVKDFQPDGSDFRKERIKNAHISLALFWSSRGNPAKFLEYYNHVKEGIHMGLGSAFASGLVRSKAYKEALMVLDDIRKDVENSLNNNGSLYTYLQVFNNYALSYYNLGKKQEALNHIRMAWDKSDKKDMQVNSTYATILHGMNKHAEAIPIMEDLAKRGMAAEDIKILFRESYIKNGGTSDAFNNMMNGFANELLAEKKKEAKEKLLNEPSFAFSLRDMEGRQVSLSDYKGQVVVLDFWATWCGPCIKSMPAMQMAVNKYEKDPRVKFLFIDTGEKIPDFEAAVEKLMKDNNYSFHVVYDTRDKESGRYAVAQGYKVRGIPTKLVLDGEGNIRYRIVGFPGGDDAAVAELTAMIESLKSS